VSWLTGAIAWFFDPANWQGALGIPKLVGEHVALTAAALGLACLVGLPLAVWLGHVGRGGVLAVQVSNIGRAVPTLALLVILVLAPPPFGLTTLSALVAFTLFAIPPIVTNTYVGMRDVDRGAVDAARGMGMTGQQVLWRVELPLATPLLMTGVRLAAVQLFATVSIAAIAAFGGLGRIITRGVANRDVSEVVAGALLIAVLALVIEVVFEWATARVDPRRKALRASQRRTRRAVTAAS
jgi:osmoprotectant transport system permease protein